MGRQQKEKYEVKGKERATLSNRCHSQRRSRAPVAHLCSRQDRFLISDAFQRCIDSATTNDLGSLRAVQTKFKRRHLRAYGERGEKQKDF